MPRVARLLVVGLFALLVVVPVASSNVGAPVHVVAMHQLDQPTATPNPTAPSGPNLNPEQQQPPDKARQKLVIGVLVAVLLAIVFVGRSARRKRKKKAESATVK